MKWVIEWMQVQTWHSSEKSFLRSDSGTNSDILSLLHAHEMSLELWTPFPKAEGLAPFSSLRSKRPLLSVTCHLSTKTNNTEHIETYSKHSCREIWGIAWSWEQCPPPRTHHLQAQLHASRVADVHTVASNKMISHAPEIGEQHFSFWVAVAFTVYLTLASTCCPQADSTLPSPSNLHSASSFPSRNISAT